MTLAALFVETNGIYFGKPTIEPWDIRRDARLYIGPHVVIAHPPCERWGRFANGSPMKKGYLPGADKGCFRHGLWAVEKFGGVLEHPAHSKAWKKFCLKTPPRAGGWIKTRKGYTCSVEQGHYGHAGRKATWLYLVGFAPPAIDLGTVGAAVASEALSRARLRVGPALRRHSQHEFTAAPAHPAGICCAT